MARLYSNENFPLPAVQELRSLGHDVLTSQDAGKAQQSIPDEDVLAFASEQGRALLTPDPQERTIPPGGNGWTAGPGPSSAFEDPLRVRD